MARPRKHFTPDEKKAAGRIKSKRYYDKNRAEISAKRRKNGKGYESTSLPISIQYYGEYSVSITSALQLQSRGPKDDTVSQCIRAAKCLFAEFTKFIRPGQLEYANQVYIAYMKTRDQGIIQDGIKYLDDILVTMRRHEGDILEVAGLNGEWEAVRDMVTCIHTVLGWLEDLLCCAMDDVLSDMYHDGCLQYQLHTT
ncbi:hypothetical protein BD779DRAFT_1475567 [Infundibulicybe gibba]|nr:hypothetical protein BD779DRAFT_1475567 [Infundibulicybe gibba]